MFKYLSIIIVIMLLTACSTDKDIEILTESISSLREEINQDAIEYEERITNQIEENIILQDKVDKLSDEVIDLTYKIEMNNNIINNSRLINNEIFVFYTVDINKQFYNDDGNYVDLILSLPQIDSNYSGESQINEYFLGLEELYKSELPELPEEDVDYKIYGKDFGYFRSANYRFEAIVDNILSVSAELDGQAGGVSWAGYSGNIFDLDTGEVLSLSDLFIVEKDIYMETIYDNISRQIERNINDNIDKGYGSPYFFDDPYTGEGYDDIRKYFSGVFYITEDELVIIYDKYALTAGAAGPQKFFIPYEELVEILGIDVPTKYN